jgi:hypothetical protein
MRQAPPNLDVYEHPAVSEIAVVRYVMDEKVKPAAYPDKKQWHCAACQFNELAWRNKKIMIPCLTGLIFNGTNSNWNFKSEAEKHNLGLPEFFGTFSSWAWGHTKTTSEIFHFKKVRNK